MDGRTDPTRSGGRRISSPSLMARAIVVTPLVETFAGEEYQLSTAQE
jgi:hypothetical protein